MFLSADAICHYWRTLAYFMARGSRSKVLFSLFLREVLAVVFAFHCFENCLHFLGLSLPFGFIHLRLAPEEFLVGLPVAATETVPQCGELSIIVVEVEVVHRVASSPVDDRAVGNIFSVVNHYRP